MAWTTPMTAALNATFTAAEFNTHVRDNLNETSVAKASTPYDYFVSDAANSITTRKSVSDFVGRHPIETTTSTSYTDLSTVGPQVTVTTGTKALVFISAAMATQSTNSAMMVSFAISGSTTLSANDDWMIATDGVTAHSNPFEPADQHNRRGISYLLTSLNAGSNTFTMKYRVGSSTGRFFNREIVVLPL